ncbi:MAG: hypothetical protein FWH22_10855, partial [Fibromonadales bacterium]|nr:hypothetical protein [Fibromonadales bacterium]
MSKLKFLLTASLLLAVAFTFSCSGDDGKNGKDGTSCTVEPKTNAADGFDVICDGEKIGELTNGGKGDT